MEGRPRQYGVCLGGGRRSVNTECVWEGAGGVSGEGRRTTGAGHGVGRGSGWVEWCVVRSGCAGASAALIPALAVLTSRRRQRGVIGPARPGAARAALRSPARCCCRRQTAAAESRIAAEERPHSTAQPGIVCREMQGR